MVQFGPIRNRDGTVYNPPHLKEFDEYIESLRRGRCKGPGYKCMYCDICPVGETFQWPANKRYLLTQHNELQRRYFNMHNPEGMSILDLDIDTCDSENEVREVQRKSYLTSFNVVDGIISFDLHLPAIYNELFDVYCDNADATMEDIKNVVTVLYWKTDHDDKYTMIPVDMYDGYHAICCDESKKNKEPEYMFCLTMNMGDAKFRMADCYMEDEHFRFPEGVTKFYVAVSMERTI